MLATASSSSFNQIPNAKESKSKTQTTSPSSLSAGTAGTAGSQNRHRRRRNDHAAERVVNIVDFEFDPKALHIPTGFKVIWKKPSENDRSTDEHVIRFIGSDEKDSGVSIIAGGSYSKVFTCPGRYQYYCERHVFMRGEIIVEGSGERLNRDSSSPQANPQGSPTSANAKDELDAKYKEYVSKRRSTRERLTKARANRDTESKTESALDVDPSPALSEKIVDPAELVRFGSYDGQSDDEDSATFSLDCKPGIASRQLRFGSYEEDPTQGEHQASVLSSTDRPKDHEPCAQTRTRTSAQSSFDAASAGAFLDERWQAHLLDTRIRWI